jgi:hypothetical protein
VAYRAELHVFTSVRDRLDAVSECHYHSTHPVCLRIPGIAEVTGCNSGIILWNPDQVRGVNTGIREIASRFMRSLTDSAFFCLS